jgi:hypothetical protein
MREKNKERKNMRERNKERERDKERVRENTYVKERLCTYVGVRKENRRETE